MPRPDAAVLPDLRNAAIQHDFRRLEDYTCWTQPLFKQVDHDRLERKGEFQSTHRSVLLGAINLTRSHDNSGLRLSSSMEARSGCLRRALQRAFQQRFGCGPMQWLWRRLELALEQLSRAEIGDSVSSIALRFGYLNLAGFSREFSRVYGRRPSEILQANQQRAER